jgi:hypothetical protein
MYDRLHTAEGSHTHTRFEMVAEEAHGKGDVLTPQRRQQGVCRASRPFPRVVGPLWGPSSNYPLCG